MKAINFKDTATLYDTTPGDYGKEELDGGHTVACVYLQATGVTHGDHADTGDNTARLILDPSDTFLQSLDYQLQGMVVEINPYGTTPLYWRITNLKVARDILLDNKVQHIACDLVGEKITPQVSS